MLVVNLFGAPGSGKSTGAAYVFSKLKMAGINAEYVSEFAKELVWEDRKETFKDEIYLFAKQNHRLFRLKDKVGVVVTDRPLLLTTVYNNLYGFKSKELDMLVHSEFQKYNNLNCLVKRVKAYNPSGRNQTQEESDRIHSYIKDVLSFSYPHDEIDGNIQGYDGLVDDLLRIISFGL